MTQENRIIRRITFKLVPFLILLYFIAYVDRSAVSFAQLQMGANIGIGDAAYGFGVGLFFIGYFLAEIPSNVMLARFGARIWIARIMISWGLITVGMAFIQGPISFYIMRFLLGVAEAGFFPGVLYYLTLWLPVRNRGKVLGLFMLSQPIAMVITSPLSGVLLEMDGFLNLQGWQWLFIVVGSPAILLTWAVILYLPDGPKEVKWLDDSEKDWLFSERKKDEKVYGKPVHKKNAYLDSLKDRRTLLLSIFYLPIVISIYGFGMWLPTLLNQFVGSSLVIGFLSAIPYLFSVLGLILIPRSAERLNDQYGHLAGLYALGAIGFFLTAWLNVPVLQFAALCMVGFSLYAFGAVFWILPGRFLAGSGAAAGMALINSIGNLGGYIGPSIFGYLKEWTGSLSSGMYFLSIISCIGVLLSYIVYKYLGNNSLIAKK